MKKMFKKKIIYKFNNMKLMNKILTKNNKF